MKRTPSPPSRSDIEGQFVALVAGRIARADADRWAAQWATADDPGVNDPVVWWALDKLYGVDLRHGPGMPYLHDQQQLAGWLVELRARCG